MCASLVFHYFVAQLGYLQVRDPVVVNVTYFVAFTDDPTISPGPRANIQRGAAMLFATAEFRKLVCTGMQPPETIGKHQTPIDPTAYKYMFNASRIPRRTQDTYRMYDPSRYTHCIVARKGIFFSMELVDANGDPLSIPILEDQLEQCITMADAIPSTRPKLGLMTSGDRDDWADAREQLLSAGGVTMQDALERLESGAMMLNLDDESPVSRQECGELFWTGGLQSGANRWFDKSLQISVTNNGKAAMIAEHSMMDGMPVVVGCNYITNVTYADAKKRSALGPISSGKVQDIFSNAMEHIDRSVVEKLEAKGRH